jgi:protein NrfD
MERQDSWGWKIAADVFLGGAGAGLFVASFALGIVGVSSPGFLRYGLLLGPILLLAGLVILFTELGRPTRMTRILANLRSSWMSVGGLIQVLFILCALGYSLPMFAPFSWLPWGTGGLGALMGVIGLVTGVLVLLYHGFLFSSCKGIPLWNTPILQSLFLLIGCSTGLAVLFLIGYGSGMEAPALQTIANIALVFLVGQGVTLWAFLTAPSGKAYESSVAELRTPASLEITGFLGLVVPAVLWAAIPATGFTALGILAGLLVLAGGFYLRHLVIKAGRYYPSRLDVP